MSMTQASSDYFTRVAGQWDAIRAGYFSDAVREAAIAKAYLRPEMVVADIGTGTGFIAAGLAPLTRRVIAIDGSPAMLEVARRNLQAFTNVSVERGESGALPLPEESMDAVFANMYLHHCPDPLAALHEMVRILRPGGRLVITDMDAHPYAWLKEELADEWQGFEREALRTWLKQAGLVNRIIDNSGQSCCAESHSQNLTDPQGREAKISIFVAAGTKPVPGVTDAVQRNYAAHAQTQGASCCSSPETNANQKNSSCCSGSSSPSQVEFIPGYSNSERAEIPNEAAEISLGCGNPTAFARLSPGEVVLDIGSGGGIDAFLSANQVGPQGKVIGVDMTPAMLERARQTALKNGYTQVEFREGRAEALPVDPASVDVAISNCVINLTSDKGQVFAEIYRVLKEGGRLEVSDMVASGSFPAEVYEDPDNWPGCVFGALPEQEYLDLVAQAGFRDVTVRRSASAGEMGGTRVYSLQVSAVKKAGPHPARFEILDNDVSSGCGCGPSCCGG